MNASHESQLPEEQAFWKAVELLYGGMPQLGPGSDAITRAMLEKLPRRDFSQVLDIGCGRGRQTLVLAQTLGTVIHAVDLHGPFLDDLMQRAEAEGLQDRIKPHAFDMAEVAQNFSGVDLLWSEGAAYHLGFGPALATWAPALAPGAFAVISECSWLTDDPPAEAREFWRAAYPTMGTIADNCRVAEAHNFHTRETFTLPAEAWREGYYNVLGLRAQELANHPDPVVQQLAGETLREIELFNTVGQSYGYVFYLLEYHG